MSLFFSSPTPKLSLSFDQAVATVAVNNPVKRNAFDLEMWKAWPSIMSAHDQDSRVRAVVLRRSVQRVVPDAELETTTRSLALEIAGNAPLAIKAAKAAIDESVGLGRPGGDPVALADACFDSADAVEGRKAFLEKRIPVFTGR
jgi:enoyl-CoA hydratase/carnithine racemase